MFFRIGLIGTPRAGKSVVGNFFVKNKGFSQFAFANQLKKEFFKHSGFTEAVFEKAKLEDKELERMIRNRLWEFSDNYRKVFGKYYFISPIIDNILNVKNNVVVTDVRTNDEMNALKEIGFDFFLVARENFTNSEYISGTRILYLDTLGFPVLYNVFENLDLLYKGCELFYGEYFGRKMAEADSALLKF